MDKHELIHHKKNMSISAILCLNTFSQTHSEEAATRENYVANATPGVATSISPLWNTIFSLTSRHEPEPDVRTTATNCDYDATTETPTAATPGANENDDDPDDKHEYVNSEMYKNIES